MTTEPTEYDIWEYTDNKGDVWVYDRNTERLLYVKCNTGAKEEYGKYRS